MKTREDNMALGSLILGIAAVLLLIWVLKVVLALFLTIAESVVTLGFYVVVIYGFCALLISIYAHFFPKHTPKLVKMALSFHHSVALSIKTVFRSARNLFVGKSQKKSSH